MGDFTVMAKLFYEPVFETTVLFITDSLPCEIDDYLKKHKYATQTAGYDTTSGSVTFLDETDGKGRRTREYMVVVEDRKSFYTLLHETHHLANHILNDRGIGINNENDEISSYVQTYWFKTLWRFMNNKKVTLKNKHAKS